MADNNPRKMEILTKFNTILEKNYSTMRTGMHTLIEKLMRDHEKQIDKLTKRIEKLENISSARSIAERSSVSLISKSGVANQKGVPGRRQEVDRGMRAKARKVPDSDTDTDSE